MKFESSFGPIHYERYGDLSQPLIVMFHVLGGDKYFFKKQINALSERYSVLTWDIPWHGESFLPDEKLNFKTIEMCFNELLDHLNIDTAVLSGVSLGGYLVQYILAHNPERFLGIHIDGAHPLHIGFSWFVRFSVKSVLFASRYMPKKFLSYMAATLLSTDAASKKMIKGHFNTFAKEHILKLFEGVVTEVFQGIERPVKKPTLITHGDHDFRFIKKRCLAFSETASNISHVIVHGGGHLHVKTYPNAFSESLLRFMERFNR